MARRALEESVRVRARECTRGWILYHLLEHFVAHYGPVLVLLRSLRERGVAPDAPQE